MFFYYLAFNIYKLVLPWDLAPFKCCWRQHASLNWSQTSIPSTAFLEHGIPYVKLFSLLPNLYITDKVSQLPGYDILASSLMRKWLCFKGFLHMHLSAFRCCLCPQFGYNWCPRVTRAFKWEQLVIIHIISSVNTGGSTRKFISSPSYLLHTYIRMLNAIIRLLCFQFSLFMLFWFYISLVNSTGCVPSK